MRINNPNPDMPLEDIQTAIDQMIYHDIFNPERGGLESINRMELTTVQHTQLI
jgi:hypothetical protein